MRTKQHKKIVSIVLFFVLFIFTSVSISNNTAWAKQEWDDQTSYENRNGKAIKVTPAVKDQIMIKDKLIGGTKLKVKNDSFKQPVYENILRLHTLVKEMKDCEDEKGDNKKLCYEAYQDSMWDVQDALKKYGFAVYVHKTAENLKGWDPEKHLWALSDKEDGYFNDNGKLFENSYDAAHDWLYKDKGYEKVTGGKECLKENKNNIKTVCADIFLSTMKMDYSEKYQLKVAKQKQEKDNEKYQKELQKTVEHRTALEELQKALKDSDTANDKAAIDNYCARSDKDANICTLLNNGKKEEALTAIETKIQDLRKAQQATEKNLAENQEALAETNKKISENDSETQVGTYEGPQSDSPNLPQQAGVTIVAYDGLFTQRFTPDASCEDDFGETDQFQQGDVGGQPTQGKIAKVFVDIISGIVKSVVDVLFGDDCPNASNGSFSFLSQILNIASPLNLTQNFIIMKLVSITQSFAYILAFAMIIFYGVMYTTGYENMEPVKFGVRMFFAMILVYFLPYLMQDILNINNVIVYHLAQIQVTFTGEETPASFVFAGAIQSWITTITENFLTNLLTLLIAILMIVIALQPIIKIFVWWYGRMIKIFFYAVIGPIMVVMMALPQTSEKASRWAKDFVGETFSQVFMVLGMAMLAFIVGNMAEFQILTNIGWFGSLLVMYASIIFLSEVPDLAKTLIGGIKGMSSLGSQVQQASRKAVSSAKSAGKGAKNVGSNAMAAASNVAKAAQTGQRWSATNSIKNSKGFTGKAGAIAGALAGKAYTARDSKNRVGNMMNKGAKMLNKNSNTNFAPFQSSAQQKVNAKVKPKVQEFVAGRENKHAQKAQNYQQQQSDLMKKTGADDVNKNIAATQADTGARKTLAQMLGDQGSVAEQAQMRDIETKNGGGSDPLNNIVPNIGGKNGPKPGTTQSASQVAKPNQQPGQTPGNKPNPNGGGTNPVGGGNVPPNGGGGAGATATASAVAGNGTTANTGNSNGSQSDIYKMEPMPKADFAEFDKNMKEKEAGYLTPGETQLNSLKRQQAQAKHEAAFNGAHGEGHANKQLSYEKMTDKIHSSDVNGIDANGKVGTADKAQRMENYLNSIGVSGQNAKTAAGKLAKESESGQSQVATAIDRAMSSNESEDVKQRMIGQALQQADIKGDAVVDVAEKIYAHENNIRAGGNASGKDNGDVVAPQTSSPQQGNGESKETTTSQVVATPTETVASSAPVQSASVSRSEVESYAIGQEGVEIIEAVKESTTSSTKPEPVIIDAEYEVVNEPSEPLLTGGSPTTPAVHSYTVGQEGVEIIDAPKESTSSSRQTKTDTVIVDAEYEVIDDSSTSSSNFANEDVMQGTGYTPASSGHVVVGNADDSANKITNVDRTIEIEYEQQETNTSNTEHRASETYENAEYYTEQSSQVSDTPHRKKELARQQRLYKTAAERYQDLEEVEVERIEREMKVSRQDAQRIAINLGKRAPKPKDQ